MHIRLSALLFILFPFLDGGCVPVRAQTNTASSPVSMGVHGLLLGRTGSAGNTSDSDAPNGFSIQEVEMRITSNIDPYWYGEFSLALHSEQGHHGEDEHASHGGEFTLDLEEAFIESLRIPHFQLRVGKFYSTLSRHNVLHTHAFPFIDAPLPHRTVFGEEGLNETGVSISYLLPVSWYLEIIAQGFSARNNERLATPAQDDLLGVYALKSLWDLSQQTTFEVDFGFGHGTNALQGLTEIYSAATVLKWRPRDRSHTRSVSWTTEYLAAREYGESEPGRWSGVSSWLQYQFATRWWMKGRGEYLELFESEQRKYSALLAYTLTEFSALRFQYDHIEGHPEPDAGSTNHSSREQEQRATLQLNITMGAHPAHLN